MTKNSNAPDIRKQLFELIFLIRSRMMEVTQKAESLLPTMQIIVLREIFESGEITQSELVKRIGRDKSQIARLISELESKKLITKTRSKTDRRNYILSAVSQVGEKMAYFVESEERIVSQMLSDIPLKEKRQLEALLIKMQDNLCN